jgi:phospholipid/cholesterol/gamma-HCH transport system substrate-binding protein
MTLRNARAVARRLITLGCAAGLPAVLAVGCTFNGAYDLPLPGSLVSDEDSYSVTADFLDVLNVVPRSAVMVDDVAVGEVHDVTRVGWHARVVIWVRNDVDLPDNAVAEIRQTSLLGEKYVALLPPEDAKPVGELSDGDQIPLASTGRNPEVEEVLGALSFLLSGGGVGQLATITHELNAVMDGRQDRLRSLLGNLDGVVGTLDEQKASIIRAMTSINDLTATLNREQKTIAGALDALAPAVEVLSAQQKNLMQMLRALDRLGVIGTQLITATKDDVISTLRDLDPVLQRLNEAGSSIGPGLSLLLSFPFPKESNNIVHGDYANTVMDVHVTLKNDRKPTAPGPSIPPLLPGLPTLPPLLDSVPSLPGLGGLQLPSLPLLRSASTRPGTGTALADCARSASILDQACATSVATSSSFRGLQLACRLKSLRATAVCRSIAALPMREVASGTPLAKALNTYDAALTTAFDTPMGTADGLYSGSGAA